MSIRINPEWSSRVATWERYHEDPRNQQCHAVGIPMIAGSVPLALSVVGLPLAAPLFVVGWTFNFVGHAIEGKKPAFRDDKRHLFSGLLWWLKRVGVVEATA